jgi:type IV fimbrial biogenesis protein FimT
MIIKSIKLVTWFPGAHGFTLIELMVTLAVAIVILAIGIPAFNAMSARDMSAATVNGLVTALQHARTEAVSRGEGVSVVGSNYNQGWLVKVATAADTDPIRVYTAPRPGQVKIEGGASPLTFNSRGETTGNFLFTVCAFKSAYGSSDTCASSSVVKRRYLCVTRAGQIRTQDVNTCP